ncbi:MAG: NUDIX domain-containing protein [Bacteroidales bacterium]|nr:NUDIX domain-containing protein [Bacteroidales bacterium]
MGKIIKISNSDIINALQNTTRQYFVGNLFKPQQISFYKDERLEIGMSSYSDYMSEPAHVHNLATEYHYVINGWTDYMDVETEIVYEFQKGDFYVIEPGTIYAQRVKAGTCILFIKVPSINDKQYVDINEVVSKWQKEKMHTIRTDYYYDENAPKPNSIKPAAAVAIFNYKKEILLLHRRDNGKWTMPGGTLEYGENLIGCALREVKEECGINVEIKGIVGTYTDPNVIVEYSDGEVRQEFTVVYYGLALDYNVFLDEESSAYKWVSLDSIHNIPMADSQRRRVNDVVNYLNGGNCIFE